MSNSWHRRSSPSVTPDPHGLRTSRAPNRPSEPVRPSVPDARAIRGAESRGDAAATTPHPSTSPEVSPCSNPRRPLSADIRAPGWDQSPHTSPGTVPAPAPDVPAQSADWTVDREARALVPSCLPLRTVARSARPADNLRSNNSAAFAKLIPPFRTFDNTSSLRRSFPTQTQLSHRALRNVISMTFLSCSRCDISKLP